MRPIVAAFVVTRVALVLTLLAAQVFFTPAEWASSSDASANVILAGLARWDGAAYLDIAQRGYEDPESASNGAYAPLYPLLMRVGGIALGGSSDAYLIAGVLISNAALLVALRSLVLLATPRIGAGRARHAAMYLLVFPTTVVLSAVYAEALFLALAVTSALEGERARWWRSGIFAALAALTRPFGVLAVVPLAIALVRTRSRIPAPAWVAAALAPLALVGWAGYLYRISGDPLRVMHVYAAWESKRLRSPLQAFTDLFDPAIYVFPWFVLVLIVIFVGLVAASWRIAGARLGAYATATLLLISSSGSLTSSMRYELALYPAFIVLGAVTGRPWAYVMWMTASALLALVFTALFVLWYWVG